MRRGVLQALGIAIALFPRVSGADGDRTRAEQLLKEGAALYQAQRFQDALERFEEAHRESNACLVLYNIGLAKLKLNRSVEGVQALERLIGECPDEDPSRTERAKQEIERAPVGRIAFETPEHTAVSIDDESATSASRPVLTREGLHKVTFVLPEGRIDILVSVRRNETVTARAPGVGHITFDAPSGTATSLDGRALGRTPLDPVLAQEGLRKITFVLRDGPVDVFVSVQANRTVTARVPLGPAPPKAIQCRPWPWVGLGVLAVGASAVGGWFATRDPEVPEGDVIVETRETERTPRFYQRSPFWLGIGFGSVAVVGGSAYLVSRTDECGNGR